MRNNSLMRPLAEAERATVRQLVREYLEAAEMARQAIEQRLSELEQRQQAGRGVRVFQQDLDNPALFFNGERSYTRAEISAIGEQGGQVIIIDYGGEAPNEQLT